MATKNSDWYFYVLRIDGPIRDVLFGITKDWESRLYAHRNSHPYPLEVIHKIKADDRKEVARLERNFAGATRKYVTPANNETRLSDVARTKAYRDPQSIPDQCSLGHDMSTPDKVYKKVRKGWLPACRLCRLAAKGRHRDKHLERMASDPEYATSYRRVQSQRNATWKAANPEKVKAASRRFTERQRARRQSDPEYRAQHNARNAKWSKENRDNRNETQRDYRKHHKPDPRKIAESNRRSYQKIMSDPVRAEERRRKAREASRRRMEDPEYRERMNAQRRARRAERKEQKD